MRRKIFPLLIGLLSFALFIPGLRWGTRQYAHRQISGTLSFDAGRVQPATYGIGAFMLTWSQEKGGSVTIAHQRAPDRVLWSSLPGSSFVAAARGTETVTDSRSHFFIEDQLQQVCADQVIQRLTTTSADALTIAGQLVCGQRQERVDYTLTFTALAPNQLGFTFTVGDEAYNRTYLTYASNPAEHFFGFGKQFSFVDFKGRRLPIFVMEQGIGRGAQPVTLGANLQARAGGDWHTTYAGVPHYITSQLRSLFLESYAYSVFDLRRSDRVHIQLFANQMSGRILYGETPAELIAEYTSCAGRMRPLPDWMLEGAIVGMQGGTQRVREVWELLRERNTPVAAFWLQDWVGPRTTSFGQQLWWNWELDRTHYPEWENLRADLAASDIKIMTYINPFLVDVADNPNHQRNLFQEAADQGFLVKNPAGAPYLIRITDFSAGLVDLTNPAARAWLKEVIREQVVAVGATGWMADFGEGLPYDAQLHSGIAASEYHNQYPEDWARLNREVIEELEVGDSFVFFMRSGYRESPRYTTLFWVGDQLVSWDRHDGIKTSVIGLLSSGMSGFSLNHSDIGGYTAITHPIRNYHRSKELLLRWMELNAFTTVYRTHEGNRPTVNAQFYSDAETLEHFDRFARVYRAWAFYRKELVQEAAATGLPVVRHPFIHYPDDPNVYTLSYQQFMVGSEFMIVPVLDPQTSRVTVYLPAGRWGHLWSGETYGSPDHGTTVTVPAPLGEPGVFYREGSPVAAQMRANLQAEGVLE